jgi:hypothetical protein
LPVRDSDRRRDRHNESLSSPYYKELDPRFKGKTHGDFNHASMETYRAELEKLGPC